MEKTGIIWTLLLLFSISTTNAQTTMYARSNGNWNDAAAGSGTWSTVSPGGVACGLVPTAVDVVIIDGYTVTVAVPGDCKDLTIESGSALSIDNNRGIRFNNSGTITLKNGGSIAHSGAGSNAYFYFESGAPSMIIESGFTFNIDDIGIAANDSLTISGAGDLTLTDDFSFYAANAYVTNNLTGNFNLTGPSASSLWYKNSSSGCTFINNGPMFCDRYLYFQAPNSVFINSSTVNLTSATYGIGMTSGDATGTIITNQASGTIDIAGSFAASNNQMTFNNYGTLDLEGDLNGWSGSAPSEFHNFSGASFYFGGTGNFYGDFYANYNGNLVEFDNTTTLQNELIDPEDNYWNITFSGFQKQMKSSFSVKGDCNIETNVYLTVTRNITMDNGGTITIGSGGSLTTSTGSGTVNFANGYTYEMVIDDATTGYEWDYIKVYDDVTLNISGAGKILLDNDISFEGNNSTVTNNLIGNHTINRDIWFTPTVSGNEFVNNEPITINDDITWNGSNNTVTNNDSIILVNDLLFNDTSGYLNNNIGGVILCGDDINFNASTKNKVNNAGTLIANGNGTGGIFYSGLFDTIVNSGTLTTLEKLKVDGDTNDDNVFINSSGGLLNVSGDFQLNDADFIFDNSGTFNLTGRFDDMGGVEAFYNRAGAVVNYYGTHNVNINTELSLYANYSGNSFNYLGAAAQDVVVPKDAYWNLTLGGSGIKETQGNLDVNGNVLIIGTADFDANTNNDAITIAGNWTSTATFNEGTELVTFDGTADQTINTAGGETFYNWTINKASGKVIMDTDVDLTNVLTLTAGACDLNSNTLTLNLQNTAAILRTAGYVISDQTDNSSKLVRNIGSTMDTFLYPFGKSDGVYIPFSLVATSGDLGYVTLSTYATGSNNLPWPTAPDVVANLNSVINALPDNRDNTIDRFWQIDKSGPSGTANLNFSYSQTEVSGNVSASENLLEAQRYNTSTNKWEQAIAAQTANATNNTVQVLGVSSFSPWSLAISSAPLPITLVEFNAILRDNETELTWATSAQINNDFFTLEKSTDAKTFVPFATIAGAGTNNSLLSYYERDYEVADGITYYRLKQTDFNGDYTYSNIVPVNKTVELMAFNVFPNPAKWDNLHVKIEGELKEDILIIIRNIQGKECYSKLLPAEEGLNEYVLKPPYELAPGPYIIIGSSSNKLFNTKLIITGNSEANNR